MSLSARGLLEIMKKRKNAWNINHLDAGPFVVQFCTNKSATQRIIL